MIAVTEFRDEDISICAMHCYMLRGLNKLADKNAKHRLGINSNPD